jgi:glycosyltransferase involved in cell wall biosynthesis
MGAPLSATQKREVEMLEHVSVYESDFRLEWMENPWDDITASGEWLQELATCVQPDVVHLNGYVHATLPWQAPVLVTAHSCVLSWWEEVKRQSAPEYYAYYRQCVRAGLVAADLVVAPTAAMLRSVKELYSLRSRGMVIGNGRSSADFRPRKKKPFVLSAGRLWDEAKNVAVLDRIADQLPWTVRVAGDTQDPEGKGLRYENVQALGHLAPQQLAAELGRASIYAAPARYEPFGLGILEGALAGCALVLGDIPSLRETWADAAIFVSPEDDKAWTRQLRRVIADDALRTDLAQRARTRARKFTPAAMAQQYLAAYERLLSSVTAAQTQEAAAA